MRSACLGFPSLIEGVPRPAGIQEMTPWEVFHFQQEQREDGREHGDQGLADTGNDAQAARRVLECGADQITTDYVERLRSGLSLPAVTSARSLPSG